MRRRQLFFQSRYGRFESYKMLIYSRDTFSFRGSIRDAKTINDHPSKTDIYPPTNVLTSDNKE